MSEIRIYMNLGQERLQFKNEDGEWEEPRSGGMFEEWLHTFDDALLATPATEAPAEPPANAEGERVPPCAECPHMKAKLDNVSGILVNALRHLTLPQMHNLGVQIANRSNATFTANTEAHTAEPDNAEGERKVEVVKSCDTCDSQEDSHYCLLHTTQVKNMNIHVCDDWREAHPQAIPANTDGERIAMVARLGIMGAYADLDTFAELWRCYIPYGKSFDDKTWRALMDRAIQLEKDGEL